MLLNQFSEPESLVKFAHQDQAAACLRQAGWKSTLGEALKES
jgi:hypothetical protein